MNSSALPPHDLDKVIGNEERDASLILKDIIESDVFANVVREAVENSEELEPGKVGASFAQQVRTKIGKLLLNQPIND